MTINDMHPPKLPATKHTIDLYQAGKRVVYVTNEHFPFPEGKIIVSRTDLKGIITHVNRAFVDISGYHKEELLGQPHSILRHPHMPKQAFADLWQTVEKGDKWHGYVKNLRKDGGHYWVYATVIPNIRYGKIISYTSVRRKISPAKIREYTQLYAKMLAEELEL